MDNNSIVSCGNNKVTLSSHSRNIETSETTHSDKPALSFTCHVLRRIGEVILDRAFRAPVSFYSMVTTKFAGNSNLFTSVPSPLPCRNSIESQEGSNVEIKAEGIFDIIEINLEDSDDSVETKLEDSINSVETKLEDSINSVETKLEDRIESVETKLGDSIDATTEAKTVKAGRNITPSRKKAGKRKTKKHKKINIRSSKGPAPIAIPTDCKVYEVFKIAPDVLKVLEASPQVKAKPTNFLGSASGLNVPAKLLPSLGLKTQPWALAIENYFQNGTSLPFIRVQRNSSTVYVDISEEMVQNLTGIRKPLDHHISLNVLTQALDLKAFAAKTKAHKATETNVEFYCKLEKPGFSEPKVLVLVFKAESWHQPDQVKLITAYTTSFERLGKGRVSAVALKAQADKQWSTIKIEHKEEFLQKVDKENLVNA